MAPPAFSDLGKQARDLFNKNYHIGKVNLDVKTKVPNGLKFNVVGTSNHENDQQHVSAHVEVEKSCPKHNITIKEKWTTDNVLLGELSVEDKPCKGLKFALKGSYAPSSKKRTESLKTVCKTENVHVSAELDHEPNGFMVNCASVFGCQGWLAGVQLGFNPLKEFSAKTNIALGYAAPDFVLHTNIRDGQDFSGSVYHVVNNKLETGISLAWSYVNAATNLGLGIVYKLDHATSLRAKIHNDSKVGLGLTHRLNDGIKLTVCALVNSNAINQGGHKLGMGIEMEA